jgi:hypothetical protein
MPFSVSIRAPRAAALAASLALAAAPAGAQPSEVTASGLVAGGYSVAATFMTPIGPAVFLQRAASDAPQPSLYLCLLEELPDTPTLTTQYCKPVTEPQSDARTGERRTTVSALLADGHAVASAFLTDLGAVVFLQGPGGLFFCLLEERADTHIIATEYCKPVE